MAQVGFTPILIYSSTTAAQAPAVGNLTNSTLGSELAINITDGKLFYKDNANAIQVIGWKTTPTTAGGTGLTSYTAGDLLYYATGTTLSKLGIGASTTVLTSSGSAPQWSAQSALSVGTAANLLSNATTGVMQIVGPAAATTRVMTIPNANFTAARTDAAQTFTGTQTFSSDLVVNGIAVGKGASSVSTNTAVGVSALAVNTSGSLNSAFGRTALTANTIGIENTAVGGNALQSNVDGGSNVGVGTYSLVSNVSGGGNAGLGWGSLRSATASNNTGCGFYAGYNLTTGSNCGFFGYNAQPSAVGVSNEYTYGDANVTSHRFYGNLTPLGAAKGINFTANTPASGSTSQLLNWYEEGTFTPTLAFGGATTGITYGAQTGYYTRIGRQVTLQIRILLTSKGSATGIATVGGFSQTAAAGNFPAAIVDPSADFLALVTGGATFVVISADTIYFLQQTTTGRTTMSQLNFGNTADFRFAITYNV